MEKTKRSLWKRIVLFAVDLLLISASLLIAYFGTVDSPAFSLPILFWFVGNLALCIIVFKLLGLYSIVFASVGILEGLKLAIAIVAIGLANGVFEIIAQTEVSFSTIFLFVALTFYTTVLTRFYKRIFKILKNHAKKPNSKKKKIMIVEAGIMLIAEMRKSQHLNEYEPVCFIDDDVDKLGRNLSGIKIVGTSYDIKKLLKSTALTKFL